MRIAGRKAIKPFNFRQQFHLQDGDTLNVSVDVGDPNGGPRHEFDVEQPPNVVDTVIALELRETDAIALALGLRSAYVAVWGESLNPQPPTRRKSWISRIIK